MRGKIIRLFIKIGKIGMRERLTQKTLHEYNKLKQDLNCRLETSIYDGWIAYRNSDKM